MVNYVNKPGSKNAADAMSNTITMNPANQTCMLATTKPVDKVETLDAMLDERQAGGRIGVGDSYAGT